jgi:hypothetical protein
MPARRLRKIQIGNELLEDWLIRGFVGAVADGLPADTKIVGCYNEDPRFTTLFLESAEFEPVGQADPLPTIGVQYRQLISSPVCVPSLN